MSSFFLWSTFKFHFSCERRCLSLLLFHRLHVAFGTYIDLGRGVKGGYPPGRKYLVQSNLDSTSPLVRQPRLVRQFCPGTDFLYHKFTLIVNHLPKFTQIVCQFLQRFRYRDTKNQGSYGCNFVTWRARLQNWFTPIYSPLYVQNVINLCISDSQSIKINLWIET